MDRASGRARRRRRRGPPRRRLDGARRAIVEVLGEAEDGATAVAAADVCPDVVLMDLHMPGTSGTKATEMGFAKVQVAGRAKSVARARDAGVGT